MWSLKNLITKTGKSNIELSKSLPSSGKLQRKITKITSHSNLRAKEAENGLTHVVPLAADEAENESMLMY